MDFIGKKIDGKFVAPAPIAEQARKYWDRIKEGSVVIKSLSVPHKDKSNKQLGAIWGLLLTTAVIELEDMGYDTSFIYNLPNPTGIAITKDDLCMYFYAACPIYNENGKQISLSKANIAEAAKFFDDVRNLMASQWGIIIPEPDPNWKEKQHENTDN